MKPFIFLLVFILFSKIATTQQYFNERFGFGFPTASDGALNALEIEDGYVINGGSGDSLDPYWPQLGMIKLNYAGEIEWKKIWGDTISQWYYAAMGSLIKHWNAYYTIGSKNTWYNGDRCTETLLIKYDENFDTLWTALYGEKYSPYDSLYIARDFTGIETGFVVVGTLVMNQGEVHEVYLLKMDSLGNVLWEHNYPNEYFLYSGTNVITTTDNGYAIGSYKYIIGPYGALIGDPVVIKTDSLGNKEWELNLGGQYQDGTAILAPSEDGNIYVAARFDVDSLNEFLYKSRVQLTKIDNSGNIIWNYLYGDKVYYENVANIRPVDGNGVIITGSHWEKTPNYVGFMLRVDSLGDSLWYRQYSVLNGKNSMNFLYDAIPVSNGGFLGAGYCYPSNPDTGTQDAWAIKVDSLGCTSPYDCWVGQKEIKTVKKDKKLFTVYPNPATEAFTIKIDYREVESYKIDIFDIYGSKVKEIKVPKSRFETLVNVADWEKGMYIIRLTGHNGQTSSSKIILTW